MGGAGNSDAWTDAQPKDQRFFGVGWVGQGSEGPQPKRPRRAQINAIDAAIDLQRRGQPAGAAREIEQPGGPSMPFHLVDALDRFERADQNSAAHTRRFGTDVEHEMIAIGKINVAMAVLQKQRTITAREAAECMRRGIANRRCTPDRVGASQ